MIGVPSLYLFQNASWFAEALNNIPVWINLSNFLTDFVNKSLKISNQHLVAFTALPKPLPILPFFLVIRIHHEITGSLCMAKQST